MTDCRKFDISISIVSYAPSLTVLRDTIGSLVDSLEFARKEGSLKTVQLVLVDNGPGTENTSRLAEILCGVEKKASYISTKVISGHGNVGFGAGHNLAISANDSTFYLVLNPDVLLEPQTIYEAIKVMVGNSDVGLLCPQAVDEEGMKQYLCKRYPSLLDLGLRGFAPSLFRRLFQKRLDRYEMRDVCSAEKGIWDVPIVSGCFMFFRQPVLEKLGGFSPDYFLYFEDFDLSLRSQKLAQVVYAPAVRISHFGGYASGKGWRHISMFVSSGYTFFQTHGWKLW